MLKGLPEEEGLCLMTKGQEGGGPTWLLRTEHPKVWEQPLRRPSLLSSPSKLGKVVEPREEPPYKEMIYK